MNPLDVGPAQRGNRAAQARIFAAMIPTARYWARRLARHEAEDAQQTAMLSIFGSLRTYDASRGAFFPFAMFRMKTLIVLRHVRRRTSNIEGEFTDEAPLADEVLSTVTTARIVRLVLRKVPARDISLVHDVMEGKTFAQIGEERQVTRQAVHFKWKRIARGLKKALVRHGVAV